MIRQTMSSPKYLLRPGVVAAKCLTPRCPGCTRRLATWCYTTTGLTGRRAGLLAAVSAVGETTSPSAEDASTAVIDSVLDGLDSINAEVLRLTVWEALSPSEIAQVLAIEPGAARVRLLRARRRAQDLFLETHPIPAMQGESHA